MDRTATLRGLGTVAAIALAVGCGNSGQADAVSGSAHPGAAGASGQGGASGSGTIDDGDGAAGGGLGAIDADGGSWGGGGAGEAGATLDGGAGGEGGSGPSPDLDPRPDVAPGSPISADEAPDGKWARIEFSDGYCRNGEKAHLMVRRNSASKKVAIYLEGGGACFNDASCMFLTFDAPSYLLGQGIFNFKNPDNPIGDWNVFYVPYCTGDVHAGDNEQGKPGLVTPPQHYSGYTNMKLYLSRILATVPDATDELLTGSSAGGFGAGLLADLVARNVPPTVERFTMLDDSGPPMSDAVLPRCLQDKWQSVWGFQNTVLKDCGVACKDPKNFTYDYVQFLLDKYAKGPNGHKFMAGLISSSGDAIISLFFGYGADGCNSPVPISVSSTKYLTGLLDLRYTVKSQTDRFGTYYFDSSAHTTLMLDKGMALPGMGLFGGDMLGGLYDTKVGDVKLTDWIRDLLDHKQASHVGP